MRILVAGCGAVGGILAGTLARAGRAFVVADDDPAIVAAVRERGLRVSGEEASFPVDIVFPGELAGPFDAVFLAVKGPHLGEAMRAISPHMHRDTFFVTLQAGWPVGAVAEMIEPKRVVGGLAGFHAASPQPGVVELVAPGRLSLGEISGPVSPRLQELAGMFEPAGDGFPRLTPNITGELWSALRASACLGSLGALTGSRLTDGAMVEEVWDEGLPLWDEVEDLARLEGVELEEVVLKPDPLALVRAARPYAESMLSDLERGERTEVDLINGFVEERARIHGAQTPVNNALRTLVKEMEKGSRAPGPANLSELRRRIHEERNMGLM